MRVFSIIGVVLMVPYLAFAQASLRDRQAAEVKQLVGLLAARDKAKVEVVTRDLMEREGKIIAVEKDVFVVEPKERKPLVSITIGAKPAPKRYRIAYRDVLQLEGKGGAISFVPNPALQPFADWDDVRSIGAGAFLQLHLQDGKKKHGVFMHSSDDNVTILRGNTMTETSRAEITRVYRISGDTRSLSAKLIGGASKGREITDDILPILDPAARANPASLGIGAGVGALIYLLPKGDPARVLVYAK